MGAPWPFPSVSSICREKAAGERPSAAAFTAAYVPGLAAAARPRDRPGELSREKIETQRRAALRDTIIAGSLTVFVAGILPALNVLQEWREGTVSVVGQRFPLEALGARVLADHFSSEPVVVADIAADPRFDEGNRPMFDSGSAIVICSRRVSI